MPYSSEHAPGLVLGHGNVGDGLSTDAPDFFVSSDGGYTWNRGLKGRGEKKLENLPKLENFDKVFPLIFGCHPNERSSSKRNWRFW